MKLLIKTFFNFAIVIVFIASVSPCAHCVEVSNNSVDDCCEESPESNSSQSDETGGHCLFCEFEKCGVGQEFSVLNIKTEFDAQNVPPLFVANNFFKFDLFIRNQPISKSKIVIGSYHSQNLCIKNCRFLI